MINKLEKFIKEVFTESETKTDPKELEKQLMIATTVLFLEMAYADFNLSSDEEEHMKETLQDFFMLSSSQVDELIDLAKENRADKNDIWTFAGLVKEKFSRDQKLSILEKLWLLIYADGTVDKYEDRLIRKITTLLGLEHGEMIQAKLNAKNKLKI
jgi:uncharacterized tellurite resistance protein B-like protein